MSKFVVWGFNFVPPVAQGLVRDLRVRWALEEAGFAYDSRWIPVEERKSGAWRRKHPFGMVPAVETANETLIESGAIVYAIAENCDSLMPADRHHETLTWMFTALNTVEPPLWNLFVMDVLHQGEAWAKLRRDGAIEDVRARLAALAGCLEGHEYLLGRFTAADLLMTTVLRFIRHTELLAEFHALDAYVKRCEARPGFQASLQRQLAEYAQNVPEDA